MHEIFNDQWAERVSITIQICWINGSYLSPDLGEYITNRIGVFE